MSKKSIDVSDTAASMFLPRIDRYDIDFQTILRMDVNLPASEALFHGLWAQKTASYRVLLQWLPPLNLLPSDIHTMWRQCRRSPYILQPLGICAFPQAKHADTDVTVGPLLLVLEHFDGIPLDTLLSKRKITPEMFITITDEISNALESIQAAGMSSCQLSSSDILINKKFEIKVTNIHLLGSDPAPTTPTGFNAMIKRKRYTTVFDDLAASVLFEQF